MKHIDKLVIVFGLLLLTGVGLMSLVTASDYLPHKQNTNFDLIISSNNATQCNFTYVQYPNGSKISNTFTMVKSGKDFSVTVLAGNFSDFGPTCMGVTCYDGVEYEAGTVCRDVTYFGKEISSAQGTIYVALLAVLIFILFATFFGMGYLPASNVRDEEGRILQINHLKHFRLVLWLFAYFLFVAIIYLSSNIAFAYLSEQLFGKLLFSIFAILLAVSPVVIILLVVSFFVKFYHDKQFQAMLNRGIFPGGNL